MGNNKPSLQLNQILMLNQFVISIIITSLWTLIYDQIFTNKFENILFQHTANNIPYTYKQYDHVSNEAFYSLKCKYHHG